MELIKKVERITIAIFIKLLAISIVASSLLGFKSKDITLLSEIKLDLLSLLLFFGEILKKATSDPDIRAERNSKTTTKVRPIRILINSKLSKEANMFNKIMGSGSNA